VCAPGPILRRLVGPCPYRGSRWPRARPRGLPRLPEHRSRRARRARGILCYDAGRVRRGFRALRGLLPWLFVALYNGLRPLVCPGPHRGDSTHFGRLRTHERKVLRPCEEHRHLRPALLALSRLRGAPRTKMGQRQQMYGQLPAVAMRRMVPLTWQVSVKPFAVRFEPSWPIGRGSCAPLPSIFHGRRPEAENGGERHTRAAPDRPRRFEPNSEGLYHRRPGMVKN